MHYHLKHFFALLSWGIIAIAMNGVRLHELSKFTSPFNWLTSFLVFAASL